MDRFDEGLRCQDVHAGLRNVDPNSGTLTPLAETQLIGMAASLAALIRGQDVIADAQALRAVAANQLDVNQFAFDPVITALADVGFIEGVQRSGGRITRFTESVPYYHDLYAVLGQAWRDRQPTEVEQQMILLVDRLADAPVPVEELADRVGLDDSAVPTLLEVAGRAELVKTIQLLDGDVVYSPFFGFENPELVGDLVHDHGSHSLADAFATLRGEQGMPVTAAQPLLQDAIARGLLLAPAVESPDGERAAVRRAALHPGSRAAARPQASSGEGARGAGLPALRPALRRSNKPVSGRPRERDRQAARSWPRLHPPAQLARPTVRADARSRAHRFRS